MRRELMAMLRLRCPGCRKFKAALFAVSKKDEPSCDALRRLHCTVTARACGTRCGQGPSVHGVIVKGAMKDAT